MTDEELKELQIGTWHDMPNYGCPHCPFSSVTPAIIRDHVAKHSEAPKTRVPLVDARGNQLAASEPDKEET